MEQPQNGGGERTSDELIALLRSKDACDRREALEQIYPGQTVTLVQGTLGGEIVMSSTKDPHIPTLFTALCWATQQIGRACGMALCWVGSPDDGNKIVVPGSSRLPPTR